MLFSNRSRVLYHLRANHLVAAYGGVLGIHRSHQFPGNRRDTRFEREPGDDLFEKCILTPEGFELCGYLDAVEPLKVLAVERNERQRSRLHILQKKRAHMRLIGGAAGAAEPIVNLVLGGL